MYYVLINLYICIFWDYINIIYLIINVFMMFLFRNYFVISDFYVSHLVQHQNLLYRQCLLHNNLAYTQGSVDLLFVPFSA